MSDKIKMSLAAADTLCRVWYETRGRLSVAGALCQVCAQLGEGGVKPVDLPEHEPAIEHLFRRYNSADPRLELERISCGNLAALGSDPIAAVLKAAGYEVRPSRQRVGRRFVGQPFEPLWSRMQQGHYRRGRS